MSDQDRLFERGEGDRTAVGDADNTAVEHSALPAPVQREQVISLTLIFDTEEERDELVGLLSLHPKRRANPWRAMWPEESADGALFDLDAAE